MAKFTPVPISSLANETAVVANITANNERIAAALENTLSRDGTSPNQMEADLDMNSNRITNLVAATASTEPVRKAEFDDAIADLLDIQDSVDEAAASATAAAASAVASAASATAASAFADAAEAAADLAGQLVESITNGIENFSGDGAETNFTLSEADIAEENTQVFVEGVYQQKNTYSISGTTLTFSAAPPTGTNNIEVVIGGTTAQAVAVPVDGSITAAKLDEGLTLDFITRAEAIATSIPTLATAVRTGGYTTIGDLGGGLYKKAVSEPSHAGKFQSADGAWWELFERRPNAKMFGAAIDGSTDDYTPLLNLLAYSSNVVLTPGDYFLSTNLTIAAGKSVTFEEGAAIELDTATILTINGRIIAGDHQEIFKGELIQNLSGSTIADEFDGSSTTPFTFNVVGTPQIPYATAYWFGAAGDGVADDTPAVYAALYFAKRLYVPHGADYLIDYVIRLMQNEMHIWGDGKFTGAASVAGYAGMLGFRGLPPSTASGEPTYWVTGCSIKGITIDGSAVTNVNGVGFARAQNCVVDNVKMYDIGRKAVTMQRWCRFNRVSNIYVDAVSTEDVGENRAGITIEGQAAGVDYSDEGGVASSADMLGLDMYGNTFDNLVFKSSLFRGIQLGRCTKTLISNVYFGNITEGDAFLLTSYATYNVISNFAFQNVGRRFFYFNNTATHNLITNGNCGEVTSGSSTGYAIHFETGSEYNTVSNVDFSHANGSVSRCIYVEGNKNTIDGCTMRAGGTGPLIEIISDDVKITNNRFEPTGRKAMVVTSAASRTLISGNYFEGASANTLIEINGPKTMVINNFLRGTVDDRIFGDANALDCVYFGNILDGTDSNIALDDTGLYSSIKAGNPNDVGAKGNFKLGRKQLWVDGTNDVRVLGTDANRVSDTSGTVVGTQS